MESDDMESEPDTDADMPRLDQPRNEHRTEREAGKPRVRELAMVATVVLLAVAIAAWWFLRRTQSGQAGRPVPAPAAGNVVPAPSGQPEASSRQQEGLVLTLSQDKLEAARIKTEPATGQPVNSAGRPPLRTTGTVASNQYKETPVFPIVGGVVRQVYPQLGNRVRRGQALLTIFSTELANAQAEYLKMAAEFEEHEKAHHRTAELVEIGAASREDLEQHKARVESMRAALAAQRQQLIQYGMTSAQVDAFKTPDQVNSLLTVAAPVSGTVISRSVNSGEVVATGKELIRVADLSTVWVLGQIYEKDMAAAREATPAVITTPAYPGTVFNGRVSYVDPRVDPQTRTAQVRIEVPNPRLTLRIGMYVDVILGGGPPPGTASAVTIPKEAVQNIGSKKVVFVATDQAGEFIQRDVTVGPESGGRVQVYSGIAAGERVVTDGSFLLRAESLKQRPDQGDTSKAQ
jgi:RND family efflux transporter MFP subunit